MISFLDGKIIAVVSDITQNAVCAIVNAANSSLMGGGGVDGAIHRNGGPVILEECREIRKTQYPNGLPTGEAVVTSAGKLPAKFVIHTVGPVWNGGLQNEDNLLKNAYLNSLKLADKIGCKSISFPAISTGIYGFPPERAAKIVSNTLKDNIKNTPIEQVYLVFFSKKDYDIFIENQVF